MMDEWMRQPVSHLKRLVKSRAGRVAELQMEIKILEGIIDRKVLQGEFGGSAQPASPEKREQPKAMTGNDKPAPAPNTEAQEETRQELSKISAKSSDHAFEELD